MTASRVFYATFVFILCLIFEAKFLENGLARTPPMGWMSWGYYMCADKCDNGTNKCLDENLIMSVADAIYSEGYQEVGYEYIIIDDCWSAKHRVNGRLVPDPKRFPRGMKFLADYIHKKGLKFGMYTNIAKVTCMHYPGSRGYFAVDMQQFAEWDIDYLKVDGCFVEKSYLDTAYIDLGKELLKNGRPILYSCSWPYYDKYIHNTTPNYPAVAKHCNLWRNYHDVFPSWNAVLNIILHYIEMYDVYSKYHGPGHWNDPDMLMLGVGVLSESQTRIQIITFSMLSAPLLLSCNMGNIQPFERHMLQNMDLIAVAQDPLGIMAKPHRLSHTMILLVKPHLPTKGDMFYSYSFAAINIGKKTDTIKLTPAQYGLNSTDKYTVMNILSKFYLRNISRNDELEITVPREDVVMYTLYPL